MSNDSDRGWNIVLGRARKGWVAQLFGASRNGEISLPVVIAVLFALGAIVTHYAGFW